MYFSEHILRGLLSAYKGLKRLKDEEKSENKISLLSAYKGLKQYSNVKDVFYPTYGFIKCL